MGLCCGKTLTEPAAPPTFQLYIMHWVKYTSMYSLQYAICATPMFLQVDYAHASIHEETFSAGGNAREPTC